MANKSLVIAVLLGLLITAVIVGVSVYFGSRNTSSSESQEKWDTSDKDAFPSCGSPLDFFGVDDALEVTWYHGANSLGEMEEALEGDYQMLEGDIILNWSGFPNQTNEPVMAHPPASTSDNTLHNWLVNIFARTDKAPKLDFKGDEVMEPSLLVLQSVADMASHPVWANADVVQGPGSSGQPIDFDTVMTLVNQYFPNMTLSLGWTTGCCNEYFTHEMMEEMWVKVHNISQPVTFPARAALFKESWPHFKWLLQKDPTRFSITVWTPSGALAWEGASIYDMLYIRNDIDKRLIYYDLPGPKFEDFKDLAVTAGSPFNHFDALSGSRDGLSVTWAHGVNSQQELEDSLNGDVMMLEADVILRGQGLPNQTNIPVMAHPPDTDSDITLEEWLSKVVNTTKGMKLDFKSIEALEPSMEIMKMLKGQYQQPIWINADIFEGPTNPQNTPVNATEFKRVVLEHFPESTLSIGWTTTGFGREYTAEMVAEMSAYARDFQQPITYPIRAKYVRDSWDVLSPLLDESRSYTMTIWSGSSDNVDVDDLVYVRNNYEIDRIYYDLPSELMDQFLDRLNMTAPSHVYPPIDAL